MAVNVKLMTSAGGGVILDTATTTATDVTIKVPVTGVNNGTLVCSDSSGNVGIGVNSPDGLLTFSAAESNTPKIRWQNTVNDADAAVSTYDDSTGTSLCIGSNFYVNSAGSDARFATDKASLGMVLDRNGFIAFQTNTSAGVAAERMRIDSSGNLLVGCTSLPSSTVAGSGFSNDGNGTDLRIASNTTSSDRLIWFYNPNGLVGGVVVTGSSTAYNTSSDYRLKENIQPMQNALAVVQQLNPVTYTWKADGSDGQGFIAHELQAVVPDCVTGEKDAVDAEGNPVYQGIDTSFLVATLTKAIQELNEKVEAQAAEIAALKGAA